MTKHSFLGLRIVNKSRFISFISILLIIISFTATAFFSQTSAKGQSESKYIRINVQKGDTLWEIAQKYNKKGRDIRKFIHHIKTQNNLKSSALYVGQTLIICTE